MTELFAGAAAAFAALCSFLLWRTQHGALLESVRPEIVLSGWSREERALGESVVTEVISFAEIVNVGRGPAFHVHFQVHEEQENRPTAIMSTHRFALLGRDQSVAVPDGITIWWKNVAGDTPRLLEVPLTVGFWDSRGTSYETTYRLAVFDSRTVAVLTVEELAPGVSLTSRSTRSSSGARRRLRRFLRRFVDRLPNPVRRRLSAVTRGRSQR